ncbi:MAG: Mur ligase family protein, partial [Pseudomonadota bacterium]
EEIGYPVVVKPLEGSKGKGVAVDLREPSSVAQAFAAAQQYGEGVLVERFIPGDDHRILVLDGKVLAVARRQPAHVIGDGRATVQALVDAENANPKRGEGFLRVMQKIKLDADTQRQLANQNLRLDSVVAPGQVVRLKGTANMSTGGSSLDLTAVIHPDNRSAAEAAARLCDGNLVGVDFLSPDISRSYRELGGAICELNMCPGLRPHQAANPAQDLGTPIVASYIKDSGRIPTASITGTNGKTTTTNMVRSILSRSGLSVGSATTSGVFINGEQVRKGDCAGGPAAQRVLDDPAVEVAVLETARRGILSHGLGYDRCEVSAITNLGYDHLGIDGVETIEQLAEVKGVVARSSRDLTVLNAGCALSLALIPRLRSQRLCLVSATPVIPAVDDWPGSLLSCTLAGGNIVLREGAVEILRLPASDIPATFNGSAAFNVENAQFAIAIAHGLGAPAEQIVSGITHFDTSFEMNKGRCNVFRGFEFPLLMDYVHNTEGFSELGRFLETHYPGRRRLINMVLANNRSDDFYQACVAEAARQFDAFYCYPLTRQDARLTNMETRDRIVELLLDSGVPQDRVFAFDREEESLKAMTNAAQQGDVVIAINEDADKTLALLRSINPALH